MTTIESSRRAKLGSIITKRDMKFHDPAYRDYRWMETNWFTWLVPEAHMRCFIRTGFRLNLGVAEFTCYVWSNGNPHAGLLDLDYYDARHHVPIPPSNLDDYRLETGLAVKMTRPLEEWTLRFDGAYDTVFDLNLRGMMPPVHVSETGTDEADRAVIHLGHLDQMMSVTGTVRVRGRDYPVNWPSPRDHSWSPRPEGTRGYASSHSSNFDYGAFGNDFVFFVQTTTEWTDLTNSFVTNGYIIDHGELLRLKTGRGRYTYEDNGWVTTRLEYELEDERGRTHTFRGEPKSFYNHGVGTLAVVEWRNDDGEVGWGEYNWHGDLYKMQELGRPVR